MRTSIRPKDIVLRPEKFKLLKLEGPNASVLLRRVAAIESPFLSVIREQNAVSLLISEHDAKSVSEFLTRATIEPQFYRVITFTPTLPWTLIGFMARVATALADAKIPLGALSSFDRDHVFVRDEFAAPAMEALKTAAREGRLL
jgi:uncharacterized protein